MDKQMLKWTYKGAVSILVGPYIDKNDSKCKADVVPFDHTKAEGYTIVAEFDTPFSIVRERIIDMIYDDIKTDITIVDRGNIIINDENISVSEYGTVSTMFSAYIGPVSLCIQVHFHDGKSLVKELGRFDGAYLMTIFCSGEKDKAMYATVNMQLADFIDGIRSSGIVKDKLIRYGFDYVNPADILIVLNQENISVFNGDKYAAEKVYTEKCKNGCEGTFHNIRIVKYHLEEDNIHE